jgi:hypothetical protein
LTLGSDEVGFCCLRTVRIGTSSDSFPLLSRYGVSTFSTNIGLARLLNERNISGEAHNWNGIATTLDTKENRMSARKKMCCNGVDGLLY